MFVRGPSQPRVVPSRPSLSGLLHPFSYPPRPFPPSEALIFLRSALFSFSYPPESSENGSDGAPKDSPNPVRTREPHSEKLAQSAPTTKLLRRTLVEGFPALSCNLRGGKLRRTSLVLSGAPLGLPDTNTIGFPRTEVK